MSRFAGERASSDASQGLNPHSRNPQTLDPEKPQYPYFWNALNKLEIRPCPLEDFTLEKLPFGNYQVEEEEGKGEHILNPIDPTWTPKVRRIIAFYSSWAMINTYFGGFR